MDGDSLQMEGEENVLWAPVPSQGATLDALVMRRLERDGNDVTPRRDDVTADREIAHVSHSLSFFLLKCFFFFLFGFFFWHARVGIPYKLLTK